MACSADNVQSTSLDLYESKVFDVDSLDSWAYSPGKDMDVFLRPLIDKLNDLWVNGLETHDAAYENGVFRMQVALL